MTPEASLTLAAIIIGAVCVAAVLTVKVINETLDERARRRRDWMAHPRRR